MDKNIYDLLNNTKVDLEAYNQEQLTDIEEAKMMKFINENIRQDEKNSGKKNRRIKTTVAASVAVVMLAVGTIGGVSVMATENPTAYKIANILGIEKNLDSYETLVNKSVTKDGITLALKGVIINGDELVVSVVTSSEKETSDNFTVPGGMVYINGEEINAGSMGDFNIIDEHTGQSIIRFPLLKAYDGNLDIKLNLSTPLHSMEKSPHWVFEFRTSGDELKQNSFVKELNHIIELPDGNRMTLNNYQQNALSCVIDFSLDRSLGGKNVEIYAVDENGNQIVFELDRMISKTGKFVLPIEKHKAVEDVKTLTCAIMLDGEKIGDTFVIKK